MSENRISILDYLTSNSDEYVLTPEMREMLISDSNKVLTVLEDIVDRIYTIKLRAASDDFKAVAEPARDLPPIFQSLLTYLITLCLKEKYIPSDYYNRAENDDSIIVESKIKMRQVLRISQWLHQ